MDNTTNTTDKQSGNSNSNANIARDSVTQFGRDTRSDLHGAIDRTAEKVQPTTDRLATSAHATVDKLAEKVPPTADRLAGAAHNAVDKVADTAVAVSEQAASRAKQLSAAYGHFAESGRNYVRSSPATSVLIALAAGYAVSKLLGSRR
jgi:ElaB protein